MKVTITRPALSIAPQLSPIDTPAPAAHDLDSFVKLSSYLQPASQAIEACHSSLVRDITQSDRDKASKQPMANKERVLDWGWGGAVSRERRAQRRAIAAGKGCTREQFLSGASGAATQMATVNLSLLAGAGRWVYEKCRGPGLSKRSDDGVREDMILRNLSEFRSAFDLLRDGYREATTPGDLIMWRANMGTLGQRFDALEAAIVGHESERLRGSAELRQALHFAARDLCNIDPSRPAHAMAANTHVLRH